MTLMIVDSLQTQYKPQPEVEAEVRAKLRQLLDEGVRDFFALVRESRKLGVRDNAFDYVLRQLKSEGVITLTNDFQVLLVG
jgi:hypothetical protein